MSAMVSSGKRNPPTHCRFKVSKFPTWVNNGPEMEELRVDAFCLRLAAASAAETSQEEVKLAPPTREAVITSQDQRD